MGRKTKNYNSMLLCELHKSERSMAIVAVEDQEAIISEIIKTLGCCRGEILLEPKGAQFLISPSVGRDGDTAAYMMNK